LAVPHARCERRASGTRTPRTGATARGIALASLGGNLGNRSIR
jgi:hypothetical protein